MTQKLYVDTNIFIDFLENRFHLIFFEKALKCKYTIFISNLVLAELKYQKVDVSSLVSWLKFANKIIIEKVRENDKKQAQNLAAHFNDAVHICCAQRIGVDAILTRNTKDFYESKVTVLHPNDIK